MKFKITSFLLACSAVLGGIEGIKDCGFYGGISYLYWQAFMDNLEYATELSGTIDATIPAVNLNEKLHEPNFQWNSGVRADIGYIFGNCWDVSLTGTYYQTTASNSLHNDFSGDENISQAFPIWFGYETGQFITDGNVNWDLTFGTLDLELGREFWIGRCVSLVPRIGLRTAWINNDYKVNYNGIFTGTVVDSLFLFSNCCGGCIGELL